MLVNCINNDFFQIKNEWIKKSLKPAYIDINKRLTVGKKYVVYALEFSDVPFIYIIEDDIFDECPFPFPMELFEIIDNRISKYFHLGESKVNSQIGERYVSVLSFKEWVSIDDFWDKLSNIDPELELIFRKNKELLDHEFYNPNMLDHSYKLEPVGDNWFICGNCGDSWEIKSDTGEMSKCPNCNTSYVTPPDSASRNND